MVALVWNQQQDWIEQQQREAELAQREAQREAEREALRKDAPAWADYKRLAEANLALAEEEAEEARAEAVQAEVRYVQAVHRQTGGARPRYLPGVVLLGFYCDERDLPLGGVGSGLQPARREHQALLKARETALEALGRANRIRAGLENIVWQLHRCENA